MFTGILSFGDEFIDINKSLKGEGNVINIIDGVLRYDCKNCTVNYQLIGIITREKRIKIENPLEFSFPEDFLSYDQLIFFLKQKNYYHKVSIILYDENNREFHLHRDLFGICPIYYIQVPGKFIAFSSSLTSLINDPNFKEYLQPNAVKISQYLTWLSDGKGYESSTFFLNFQNVLPGHKAVLGKTNLEVSVFSQFDLSEWKNLKTLEEFGEEFKYLFRNSVRRGLKEHDSVSAQLSGGLDSSSICTMIRNLEPEISIHTIYADTGTILTDEHKYVNEVSKCINSIHHILHPKLDVFESAKLHISLYGQPEFMLNGSALNRSIMQSATSYNCTTLFNGNPGDAIVGYGRDYIKQLFDQGDWSTLKKTICDPVRQMSNLNSNIENPSYKILYSLLASKKGSLNAIKMAQLVFNVSKFFNIPLSYFYTNGKRKIKDFFEIPTTILTAKYSGLELFSASRELIAPDDLDTNIDTTSFYDVFTTQFILMNEQFYILDYYYGIRHEFPFYDKRLFELCMSVPSQIKYDDGRQRGHFREAMKGILPELIRNRTSKANFGLYGRKVALQLYHDSVDLLSTECGVWDYVDKKEFRRAVNLLLDDKQELYVYNRVIFFISKVIYLSIWLHKLKNKTFLVVNPITKK